MRIISDFKDYYDSITASDQDATLVYRRSQQHHVLLESEWPGRKDIFSWPPSTSFDLVRPVWLLFCGTLYVFWSNQRLYPTLNTPGCNDSLMTLPKLRASILQDQSHEIYTTPRARSYDKIAEQVTRRMCNKTIDQEIFHYTGAPYMVIAKYAPSGGQKRVEILTNPRLQPLDFVKVLDPFMAYQTIATFIGSILASADEMPMTVGSDEVVLRQKGFDDNSFRTSAPGQKKIARRANRARRRG